MEEHKNNDYLQETEFGPQSVYIKDYRSYSTYIEKDFKEYAWMLPGRIGMTIEYWEKVFVPNGYTIEVKRKSYARAYKGKYGTELQNYWVAYLKPPTADVHPISRCQVRDCSIHQPACMRPKTVTVNENREYFKHYIPPF